MDNVPVQKRRRIGMTNSVVVLALLCASATTAQATGLSASCPWTTPYSVSEAFGATTYKDPTTSAVGWGSGYLRLPLRAGAFPSRSIQRMEERVLATVGGDFNNDAYDDLIVLSDAGGSCHLDFAPNDKASGLAVGTPAIATCTSTSGGVLAAGDIDGDGLLDFVYATVTNPANAGTITSAILYRNTGVVSGKPTFSTTDITTILQTASVSWHLGGSELALADWNGDGRADLLVLSSSGTTNQVLLFKASASFGIASTPQVLVTDAGIHTPIASSSQAATGGYSCPPGVSRGGTVIMPGDFNKDGLMDVVVSSVSEDTLKVWLQNPDGTMSRGVTPPKGVAGALVGAVRDLDSDGNLDLAILTSGNDCGGNKALLWLYYGDGLGGFAPGSKMPRQLATVGLGGTFMAVLDVNHDYAPDVIAGLLSSKGRYKYYNNSASTTVYSTTATATSKKVSSVDPAADGIVAVVINTFVTSNASAPNSIAFQMSNDGGVNWETLTAAELAGAEHDFTHFGTDLRWRAILTAPASTLTGTDAVYAPGAQMSTPMQLTSLSFTYYTVQQHDYSRSGLSYGLTKTATGSPLELLFGASFTYPGYKSKLTAYNISALTAQSSAGLQQVDTILPVLWEAGDKLKTKTAASRTIYTAYPATTYTNSVSLGSRVAVNLAALGTTQTSTLAQAMGITGLTNADQQALLTFILGGMGATDGSKLYDVGHSSPVFIGAPTGDANYLTTGSNADYAGFKTAKKDRKNVVLIGANDGMLHAFDAVTGDELWAYIPYNLLTKLQTQRTLDANSVASYVHRTFVDGTISVQDIYSTSDNAWHTMAVVGQAQGQGGSGNNYYFALDLTDPSSPIPRWEFGDGWVSPTQGCDTSQSCVTSYTAVCTDIAGTCSGSCIAGDSVFKVSGGLGRVEAENYDTELTSTSSPSVDWVIDTNTYTGYTGTAFVKPNTTSASACSSGSQCTVMTYRFLLDVAGTYYAWFRMFPPTTASSKISWGMDDVWVETLSASSPMGTWRWNNSNAGFALSPGIHTMNLWMNDSKVGVDTVVLQTSKSNSQKPNDTDPETCGTSCDQNCVTNANTVCGTTGGEWPSCGIGAGLQCCPGTGTRGFCWASGTCPAVDSMTGETWSPPAMGRIRKASNGIKWVAFFASGYNNRSSSAAINVGRSVYAVDAYTGQQMGQWDFTDLTYDATTNPSTIDNTIPGGATLVDADNDGYVDRLFVGDLEGRLWKLNTAKAITLDSNEVMNSNDYATCVLFDAGNPDQGATRRWAPIITKPAVALLTQSGGVYQPNVYFGTGGDDRAPDSALYRFYSVRDTDAASGCRSTPILERNLSLDSLEWVVGDGYTNSSPKVLLSPSNGEGDTGDRYWSDPVIVNGTTVYFASLNGKIESVNPCINLTGLGSKVYAYAIKDYRDSTGALHYYPGQSVLTTSWLQAAGKIRRAAVVRAPSMETVARPVSGINAGKTDVFLQSYSSTGAPRIDRVTDQGAGQSRPRLRALWWREVPL